MTTSHFLLLLFIVGLIVWLGGATTLQLVVARARILDRPAFIANLIPYLYWTTRRVYLPAAAIGLFSGSLLLSQQDVPITEPWSIFLLAVLVAVTISGEVYSMPEYKQLIIMLKERGPSDKEIHRRFIKVCWLTRIELLLISTGLIGVFAQVVAFR